MKTIGWFRLPIIDSRVEQLVRGTTRQQNCATSW